MPTFDIHDHLSHAQNNFKATDSQEVSQKETHESPIFHCVFVGNPKDDYGSCQASPVEPYLFAGAFTVSMSDISYKTHLLPLTVMQIPA
jgi:hypothetical protein